MNKRRAKRKGRLEKEEAAFSEAEEQFIRLIARILVDITFNQLEHQSKKLNKMSLKDSGRNSKPDQNKIN